jgi:hypothetical protein
LRAKKRGGGGGVGVYRPLSNYHKIDNVPPKFLIVTMSPSNYQNIVNDPPNDETTLSKKNTKTSKKNIKLKKKKKNPKGGKLKIKKKNKTFV